MPTGEYLENDITQKNIQRQDDERLAHFIEILMQINEREGVVPYEEDSK